MAAITYKGNNYVIKMVYTALMTALVFVTTFSIIIPVPFTSGYVHPGDMMVFLSGLLLGPIYGAFAAGVGSALSDLLAGYTFWVIPTLIIKSLMAFSVGMIAVKLKPKVFHWIFACGSLIWAGFTISTYLLTRQIKGDKAASSATLSALIKEGYTDADLNSLSHMLSNTSTILLVALIILPLLLAILFFFVKKRKNNVLTFQMLFSFFIGGMIMIVGYYLTYGIVAGNFIVPIFSIPANILQFLFGFIGAVLLSPAIKHLKKPLYR